MEKSSEKLEKSYVISLELTRQLLHLKLFYFFVRSFPYIWMFWYCPCYSFHSSIWGNSSSSSEPVQPLSRMIYSHSATGSEKYPHVTTSSREKASAKFSLSRDKNILGRVAPRSSTLLSKHPKDVRYVRDTCFFQPTLERKKHYYIVNPNWFSEQRVTVPKNNVFS